MERDMAKLGYARVSTTDQHVAGKIEALKAAGCERIFAERVSGKSTNGRAQLKKLMNAARPGDTVVVVKLDRFARSSRDLFNLLHELNELGVGFVSLKDDWCNTTTSTGRLVLTIMAGIAEFERELIRDRCQAGIDRAKAAGKHLGRPFSLDVKQRKLVAERYASGQTMAQIARSLDVSEATISRALAQ
jgi:DNA invertase Pin-like site-specific DNA recombinase